MKFRYKVSVEYDGTNYSGFQKQKNIQLKTIEGVLEKSIYFFSNQKVKICASGRTDAGVHALCQTIHFDLNKKYSNYTVIMALNYYLRGEDVVVIDCELVDNSFNARLSSKMRYYRYIIINRKYPLTLDKKRAWHIAKELDINLMNEAKLFLIGKHDFSSFRDSQCQSKSAVKTINDILITKKDHQIYIDVSAKSFLHHMVRNIVGTLILVGQKKIDAIKVKEILAMKDRTKSGANAPAHGLYFLKTDY